MQSVRYTCKVLTPMFLHGENGRVVQLGATPFKSAMRFWWRSLQTEDGVELLSKEERLFGGIQKSVCRSPFDIFVCEKELQSKNRSLTPHKDGARNDAYIIGSEFTVTISMRQAFSAEDERFLFYMSLFELTSLLGGVGQRSRRCAGSFQILSRKINDGREETAKEIFGEKKIALDIQKRMEVVKGKDFVTPKGSVSVYPQKVSQYIKIRVIKAGENVTSEQIREKVSEVTHSMRRADGGSVSEKNIALGTVDEGRRSSPVIISVCEKEKDVYLIASYLSTDIQNKEPGTILEIQDTFVDKIKDQIKK